jgi:hypothetical protein
VGNDVGASGYAHRMDQIATHVNISRDVPVGAGDGVWKLTLFSDTGYVVDAIVLPTRDRKANPLEEATAALWERQYGVLGWVQPDDEEWNAEVARFGAQDTITVHFVDEGLHLSGTVESYGTPRFVELEVENPDYPRWWILAEQQERGSADAHYRPYEGLETDEDVPLCTNAR